MAGKHPEILAPVGGREQLEAAVRCAADAVYMGTKSFNARKNAANFEYDEFRDAIDYCHLHGVKVYSVLNTLISDGEAPSALEHARLACDAGADALIIQDLGLAREIRRYSNIPLHASTQMSVGTLDGLKLLHSLGFKRAVLPRELSFKEIEYIAQHSPIELECFVHGALCMCVSGQCLLSAVLGSRSGNRGLCAQPCRLPFSSDASGECHLSLKDLSLVNELKALRDIGVTSFKIEGRMKRAEYVACAVTACRQALDDNLSPEIDSALQSVFSRSGFTKGHFEGKRDKSMFGIRRKEDVVRAAGVLKELEKLYEKENSVVPTDFHFSMSNGEPAVLTARARGYEAVVTSRKSAEPAIKKSLDEESIRAQLQKCGGTAFLADNITVDCQEGLSLPLSEINAMRRQSLSEISDLICSERVYTFNTPESRSVPEASASAQEKRIFARFASLDSFIDGEAEVAYLPIAKCAEDGFDANDYKSQIYAEIPRMIFGQTDRIRALISAAAKNSVKGFLINGLDALALARESGLDIHASIGANAYNSLTTNELSALGVSHIVLSAELTTAQIARLSSSARKGAFAYGRLPLMITRACPNENTGGCASCSKKQLTDRMGVKFPLVCGYGFTELLNSRPLYMGDRLNELQCDFILLYFSDEDKNEIARIMNAYKNALPPQGEFTRGLLYRGSL